MPLLEILVLGLRGLQFLFAIIELGITGHIASYGLTPSQVSFLVFVSIWTLLIVLFLALTPKFAPSIAHPFARLALDLLTTLFWFAGFIALAVFDHDLHNTAVEDVFGDVYRGCSILGNFCGLITAAVVFAAFEWALFVATTILSGLEAMRSRGGRAGATHTPAAV